MTSPPTIRHTSAPTPLGCRWCGTTQREHCQLWVPGHGIHGWVEPTRQQIEARMRVRLAARRAARDVEVIATAEAARAVTCQYDARPHPLDDECVNVTDVARPVVAMGGAHGYDRTDRAPNREGAS